MVENNYRHEYKYLVSESQIKYLENQIKKIMKPDPNAINGVYRIRSLYFDDYYDSGYYDVEDGNDPREKVRIRIYNSSNSRISLECKRKIDNKTQKSSVIVSKKDCELLMSNKILKQTNDPLISKVNSKILLNNLKPSIIVEYDRIPYVYKEGNVRVTFDTNISSSNYIDDFFKESIVRRPIMPKGMHILEVKYDGFLPDVIYQILNIGKLQQFSFSKYYLCRNIDIGNKYRR